MTIARPIVAHAPARPLRVEWRPLDAVDQAAWRALAHHALEPNVFYEPAFALPAAPVFGHNVGAGLVWSPTGRLMGLFPARVERRFVMPPAVLTGWTHPYGPLGTPLVDGDEPEAVLTAWLDHIAGAPELPGLMLLPLVPDGPFANALATVLARRDARSEQFGRHQRALLAPTRSRASYLENALGAKKRKELRRQRHRLAENEAVTVDTATDGAAIAAALADFMALEARGWKGRAGTAVLRDDWIRRFVEQAVAGLAADHKVHVERLRTGDTTIAALVTLRSGATAWSWKIAYDETFARLSPGVQLMMDVTERLLGDDSIARVDSCATPDHPMIDHLWRERLALADRLVAARASPGTFAYACRLEEMRRSAFATAKAVHNRLRGR